MAGEGKANKDRGRRHENRIASRREDRIRVPLSGGGTVKGDVQGTHELLQCKSSSLRRKNARGSKYISIQLSDLLQMEEERVTEGKPLGALVFHYKGEASDWYVVSEEQYEEMLTAWEAVYEGREFDGENG